MTFFYSIFFFFCSLTSFVLASDILFRDRFLDYVAYSLVVLQTFADSFGACCPPPPRHPSFGNRLSVRRFLLWSYLYVPRHSRGIFGVVIDCPLSRIDWQFAGHAFALGFFVRADIPVYSVHLCLWKCYSHVFDRHSHVFDRLYVALIYTGCVRYSGVWPV